MKEDLQGQIDQILGQLNEREQAVIRMRFGLMDDASVIELLKKLEKNFLLQERELDRLNQVLLKN